MKKFTKNNLNNRLIELKNREKSLDDDMGNLTLGDILDIGDIQLLMDNFYGIAHIPMSITDNEGNVLVGVGWQDICTKFHRVHPETSKKCIESDTKLARGVPKGEFRLYNCKNNMLDIATPIIISPNMANAIGAAPIVMLSVGDVFQAQYQAALSPDIGSNMLCQCDASIDINVNGFPVTVLFMAR